MIELSHLSKSYNQFHAVNDLSLSVAAGEVFGFLGPNGAGKTTTIRIMMGILVPSSGTVMVDGNDSQKERIKVNRLVGYLPDTPIFYDFMKGREILEFVGEMHGLSHKESTKRSQKLLEDFVLSDSSEDFAVNYSLGMKKKLGLACALIHQPKVLILDEPTNGLDPRAARDVQNQLALFAKEGGTVFLSTHLLDMAQKICNRIGVINKGKLVAVGEFDENLEDLFMKLTESEVKV